MRGDLITQGKPPPRGSLAAAGPPSSAEHAGSWSAGRWHATGTGRCSHIGEHCYRSSCLRTIPRDGVVLPSRCEARVLTEAQAFGDHLSS